MKLIEAFLVMALTGSLAPGLFAAERDPQSLIDAVVQQAGGEEKLLNIFRFRERVLISSTPTPLPGPEEKGNRTSVVQVGGDWWLGTNKRNKDKVRVLLWAWSLRILTEPKSKVERLPDAEVTGKPAVGLRVTESIKEPIDLYFDKESLQLVAIDYTDTRHVFSEWKEAPTGFRYPAHVVGFRFADRVKKTLQEKQWYQTDLLEVTPLMELPPELKN